MAVNDHGIEVLKKAGEEVVPGSLADYYLKVGMLIDGSPIGPSNPIPVSGDSSSSNPFAPPPTSDSFTVDYPDTVTEVYQFRIGGLAGTILKSVTLVYTDTTKEFLLSGEVS